MSLLFFEIITIWYFSIDRFIFSAFYVVTNLYLFFLGDGFILKYIDLIKFSQICLNKFVIFYRFIKFSRTYLVFENFSLFSQMGIDLYKI